MRYVFGNYILDPMHYELRQGSRLVPIEPRVFDVLAYLVQHPDQIVTTEELLAQLYPHQFAPVDRLTTAVAQARKVLGDSSKTPRYIQTVRRRGYRFLAPVDVLQGGQTVETRRLPRGFSRWSPPTWPPPLPPGLLPASRWSHPRRHRLPHPFRPPRCRTRPRSGAPRSRTGRTPSAASSRSCFVTWWGRRRSRGSSIPKTSAR